MIDFNSISSIRKPSQRSGYVIEFDNHERVVVVKRRALVGLLMLLKYSTCSEADLTGSNDRLARLKAEIGDRIENPSWIQDRYGDANKPFSELWTEEGFSCVHPADLHGNRQYVLAPEDRAMLLSPGAKRIRIQLSNEEKIRVLQRQNNRCNICGALFKKPQTHTFSKDRVKLEFDHRVPIDHGGSNALENIQALCHYCNKSKRQMCFVCEHSECSVTCALVFPENHDIVAATNENIIDRISKRLYGVTETGR